VSPAKPIAARVPPDALATNLAHRALLGARAPRLAGRPDHASRALARAMRATALGRGKPAELAWLARIDQRRRELFEGSEHADAGLWAPEAAWSIPRIWGGFLLRLVVALEPRSSLELGAGFGLSGCYQAAGLAIAGTGRLRTLDQEPTLIPRARESYAALGLDHLIELTAGPIGETLAPVAAAVAPVDFVLIDAEHTEAATVFNFDGVRPHLAPGAVVLIDDIRSTAEMRRAWETIRSRSGNALTLDLRRIGVVCVEGPAPR
jgi:predicted O-methyltransferase YrrM